MGSNPALYTKKIGHEKTQMAGNDVELRNWRCRWLYQLEGDRKLIILYLAIFYHFNFIRS